jgi:hypothetical protein
MKVWTSLQIPFSCSKAEIRLTPGLQYYLNRVIRAAKTPHKFLQSLSGGILLRMACYKQLFSVIAEFC